MNTPSSRLSIFSRVSASQPRVLIQAHPTCDAAEAAEAPISSYPTPLGFVSLMSAYRPSGGIARGDDLSRHLSAAEPGYLTHLARQIVSGSILSFQWRQSFWVPLFQFEPGTSQVKTCVSQPMGELTPAFDSWETAVWFVQPHTLLNSERPLDVLDKKPNDVLEAARNDRFVAMG